MAIISREQIVEGLVKILGESQVITDEQVLKESREDFQMDRVKGGPNQESGNTKNRKHHIIGREQGQTPGQQPYAERGAGDQLPCGEAIQEKGSEQVGEHGKNTIGAVELPQLKMCKMESAQNQCIIKAFHKGKAVDRVITGRQHYYHKISFCV